MENRTTTDVSNKVDTHQSRKRPPLKNDYGAVQSTDMNRKSHQDYRKETHSSYPMSAAEGDAIHSLAISVGQHSEDLMDNELENVSLIDASAGEICLSPTYEKQSGDYHDKFFILEEALENSHYDKAVVKSMLKTLRSYLEAHETKEKQQNEKIKQLEKQLVKTSDMIRKRANDEALLSTGDSKSLRSNLVSRDRELLRIEDELEKKTLEFNQYKSETSNQIHSLMRENECLHQELNAKKHRWKHPPVTTERKSDLIEQLHNDVKFTHKKEFLPNQRSSETISSSSNSKSDCVNCSILESQQEELLAGRLAFEATLKAVKEILENLAFNRVHAVNDSVSSGEGRAEPVNATENLKPLCPAQISAGKKSVESQTIVSYNQLCQQYLDHFNNLKENIYKKVKLHEVKICELENDMEKQSKMVTNLQNQKKEFLKDIDQLKKRLRESEQEAMDMSRKWQEDLKNVENRHKSVLRTLQSEVEQLNVDLAIEKENHAKTFSKFEAILQQQRAKVEKLNEANQTDLSIFKENFEELEARGKQVQNLQDHIAETDKAVAVYKAQLYEVQTSYNNNVKSYCDQISKLDEELRSTSSERCELIKQLTDCQSELRTASLKNEELSTEIKKLVESNDKLQSQLKSTKNSEAGSQKELERSQNNLVQANDKIEQLLNREKELWKVFIRRVQQITSKDPESLVEKIKEISAKLGNEYSISSVDFQEATQVVSECSSHDSSRFIRDKSSDDFSQLSKEDSGILGSNASTTILISKVKEELHESNFLNNNIAAELTSLRADKTKLLEKINQISGENAELIGKNQLLSEKLSVYGVKLSSLESKTVNEHIDCSPAQTVNNLDERINFTDTAGVCKKLKSMLKEKTKTENELRETNQCLQEKISQYESKLSYFEKLCLEKREYHPAEGEFNISEGPEHYIFSDLKEEKCERGQVFSDLKRTSSCKSNFSQTDKDNSREVFCSNCTEVIQSLRQKIDELQRKLAESVSAESLQESVEQLMEKETLLQKDFERLQENRIRMEKEEALQSENRALKNSVQELNSKNQKLLASMNSFSNDKDFLKQLEDEKTNLLKVVEELKDENKKLVEGKNLITHELESLKLKKAKLLGEVNNLFAKKEKIEKAFDANSKEGNFFDEGREKSCRLSLPLSSSLENAVENCIGDGNKLYADFANFEKNWVVATSTPCPNKLAVNNAPVKVCDFILEEDEDNAIAESSNRKIVPIEDLSHPYIISLECIGDFKDLREKNRQLNLEKHNLTVKLQTLQNDHNATRSKLDQLMQNCSVLEQKLEELESVERFPANGNDHETVAIKNLKEERAKINAKIHNIEHFITNSEELCEDNVETYQDILTIKEKVNALLEHKCGSVLKLKAYESKIACLNNEIKALWSINNDILSKSQLNVEELKLNIENNVVQIISDFQNQNCSVDLQKCFELIDCLVGEVRELKTDLIEKKSNLNEMLLKQSRLISGILQNNVAENLQKANDENRLLADERKKFLQIIENQEQLIHQLQSDKNDNSRIDVCNQHYENIIKELTKQREILDLVLDSLTSETTIDKFIKSNLSASQEERKALELQLEEEHAQRLALQTRLQLYQDESSKKDQLCKELQKKAVRSEVENEVNQVELKRSQTTIKTLGLQLEFVGRMAKAKEETSELESKVKTVDVKSSPKIMKSSLIPKPVSPLSSSHFQRRSNNPENNHKPLSPQAVRQQTSCNSDILRNTRKLSKDYMDQVKRY